MEMNSGKAKHSFPMELITVEAFLFLLFLLNLIKDYLIKSYLIKSYLILSY